MKHTRTTKLLVVIEHLMTMLYDNGYSRTSRISTVPALNTPQEEPVLHQAPPSITAARQPSQLDFISPYYPAKLSCFILSRQTLALPLTPQFFQIYPFCLQTPLPIVP